MNKQKYYFKKRLIHFIYLISLITKVSLTVKTVKLTHCSVVAWLKLVLYGKYGKIYCWNVGYVC